MSRGFSSFVHLLCLLWWWRNAGGHAKTMMFINVSPTASDSDETFSSLNFASRVRRWIYVCLVWAPSRTGLMLFHFSLQLFLKNQANHGSKLRGDRLLVCSSAHLPILSKWYPSFAASFPSAWSKSLPIVQRERVGKWWPQIKFLRNGQNSIGLS